MVENKRFTLHLVSDATGGTLQGLARACIAQFEDVKPMERFWNLVRSEKQLAKVLIEIEKDPGPVLFTLVDKSLRKQIRDKCRELKIPCVPVLDPIMKGLSTYLGQTSRQIPGLQYQLDEAYFERVEAVDFTLDHDDGQSYDGLDEADVILLGVSRTSKTPTSIYLANRGIRVANIPLVPGHEIPEDVLTLKHPLYVGLVAAPDRLIALRKNRLHHDEARQKHLIDSNAYLDMESVEEEVRKARRLFSDYNAVTIDVTRRSVEETSAEIITLLSRHNPNKEIF